jgi:hypothetical protein
MFMKIPLRVFVLKKYNLGNREGPQETKNYNNILAAAFNIYLSLLNRD